MAMRPRKRSSRGGRPREKRRRLLPPAPPPALTRKTITQDRTARVSKRHKIGIHPLAATEHWTPQSHGSVGILPGSLVILLPSVSVLSLSGIM